jgi:hypothetical protein
VPSHDLERLVIEPTEVVLGIEQRGSDWGERDDKRGTEVGAEAVDQVHNPS